MNNEIQITQKSAVGSETTQVAIQNNYNGMSASEASEIAIKLFMENFPKLQEEAMNVARERAEELCQEIISKLDNQGKKDFSEFSDPDMQFVLNKSQQEYARFGTQELCELLSQIVVTRVNYDNDKYMKLILDEAIEIAKFLSPVHLNYLSIIFLCKQAKFNSITSIDSLKAHCDYIDSALPVPSNILQTCQVLDMMRLLKLYLGTAEDTYSETYGLEKNAVKEILPESFKNIPGDYALSPLGIVIAIINIRNKTNFRLNFETWIKPI